MPRQQTAKAQNKFIRGLITETTALSFPEDACTETFNCVFDETGRVTRRLGFDLEDGWTLGSAVSTETNEVFTEFVWKGAASTGDKSFLVQQQGSTLRFYEMSENTTIGANVHSGTISLDSHLATNSSRDPAEFPCQYATGLGYLLVANQACEPLYITYSIDTDSFAATEVEVRHRDTVGLDDTLTVNQRLTETVATLATNNPQHYYNILNQGWSLTDALTQWDAARTDVPSNADYVALFRSSATDSFDNTRVTSQSPGNRPAAKGHFILTAWDPDRETALSDAGFTATLSSSEVMIGRNVGTVIHNAFSDSVAARAFDGTTNVSRSGCADSITGSSMYIGKTFTTPLRASKVIAYGANDDGFDDTMNAAGTVVTLYGKQGTAPTNGTDGTSLGSVSFTDTSNESAGRTATSSDTSTFWDHIWINVTIPGTRVFVAEVQLFTVSDEADAVYTIERPKCVEFFAGRAFWAGIETTTRGGNIYFSQIAEKADQFGKCYQKNDPTAEDFTDLLPDDGGIIRIPEIASVTRLFAYQNSLLVFATNGVWQISGSSGAAFLATDYVVKRLSDISCTSPHSFVAVRGIPVWWAEDGMFTVKFDANYGSFEVTSLTDQTIQSFILDIPHVNRQYVKGCYDVDGDVVYWLFNDTEDLEQSDYYKYNNVLCMNSLSGAFYPWTVDNDYFSIRGLFYAADPVGSSHHQTKFTTTLDATPGSTEYIVFTLPVSTTYTDWSRYAEYTNNPVYEEDYTSYFITGYMIEGAPIKFLQSTYAFVYFEQEDDASCYVQGLWDWTNSGDSGKWSTSQQAYNNFSEHRVTNHRRLKIRGKGKALQLKFYSETGKPFTIIGWILRNSVNADV